MFNSETLVQLGVYCEAYAASRLRDRIRRALVLADRSMRFVACDDQNQDRPFPEVYHAFEYIQAARWAEPWQGVHIPPGSIAAIRSRFYYRQHLAPVFSKDVGTVCAAFLHLVPSWMEDDRHAWLWRLVQNLSIWGLMTELLESDSPESPEQFESRVQSTLGADQVPLLQELQQYVDPMLTLVEDAWESSSSDIHGYPFHSPDGFRLRPAVIAPAPNAAFEGLSATIRAASGLTLADWQQRIARYRVVFSGGYAAPVGVTQVLIGTGGHPGGSVSYNLLLHLSGSLDGRWVQSGPINLILADQIQPIEDYLSMVRKTFAVTSRRFWLPWDAAAVNFLWVGKPALEFSPLQWMPVAPFCRDEKLLLYGVERLWVWIDGAQDVGLSGQVGSSLKKLDVALPTDMKVKNGVDGSTGLYPRRYPVKIAISNRCGRSEQSWDTGVTFPLKLRCLGYETGQTICKESMSTYERLRHQPAYGWHNYSGGETVVPIHVPLVRNKRTWVRVFFEHNAPMPYFAGLNAQDKDLNFLPFALSYTVKKSLTGEVVQTGALQGDSSADTSKCAVQYDGVLSLTDPPQVLDEHRYHHVIRNRYWGYRGQFAFPFTPPDSGPYTVECVADIHPDLRAAYGLNQASEYVLFDLIVQEPAKVRLYWIRIVPTGGWSPSVPLTDNQIDQLEEWVSEIVPSTEFQFVRGETMEYEQGGGDDSNRILDTLVDMRGDRHGICIGLIDDAFYSHLDLSITKWGGAAYYGERIAWIHGGSGVAFQSVALAFAHEFGHAHPLEYHHLPGCDDPVDADGAIYRYWQPGLRDFYQRCTCGEKTYSSLADPITRWPTDTLWVDPTEVVTYTPSITLGPVRDIMTYCGMKGFELTKTLQLLQQYDSLI